MLKGIARVRSPLSPCDRRWESTRGETESWSETVSATIGVKKSREFRITNGRTGVQHVRFEKEFDRDRPAFDGTRSGFLITRMHFYLLLVCLLLLCHGERALAEQFVERPPRSQPSGIEDIIDGATGDKWFEPKDVIAICSVAIAAAAWACSFFTTRYLITSEKKRFVLQISDRIEGVGVIDWDEPDALRVREAINALGLIASCWRNNLVDKSMLANFLGGIYQRQFDELDKHGDTKIRDYDKTVSELIGPERCDLKEVAEQICKYTNR